MQAHETRAAQLFLAHHGFVKGLAVRHAPWPGLAEDVLQQVFVEFMAKAGQWDLEADLRPLLATMTRTVALRHWREKARAMPESVRALAEHVRQLAEERAAPPRFEDEAVALRGCLQKLPEKSRSLVDLYYYAQVPTPDIARQMGMRTETVCRAICRVREKLKECIARAINSGAIDGGDLAGGLADGGPARA
ncbi:MAG TPA: sigma-70 family RNA polymerase sigma factor [Humisphaera sp.]